MTGTETKVQAGVVDRQHALMQIEADLIKLRYAADEQGMVILKYLMGMALVEIGDAIGQGVAGPVEGVDRFARYSH